MDRKRLNRWLAAAGKYKYALGVLLLGVLLMLLPSSRRGAAETADAAALPEAERFDLEAVEREMEEILSGIEGTGDLRLMLTVESGTAWELANDASVQAGAAEYSQKTQTVILGSGSDKGVVVTRSVYPRYIGALVVCEGGEDAAVRLRVTQALASLTGLPTNRITVVRGKPKH